MSILILIGIGLFSWLLANESSHSAVNVLNGVYWDVPGIFLVDQYIMLSYAFNVIAVACLVLAIIKTLLLKVSGKHRA
jgi:hypothetical protein